MDVLDVMAGLGAAITGTVPVAIVLLWLIWREVRKQRARDDEVAQRVARHIRKAAGQQLRERDGEGA